MDSDAINFIKASMIYSNENFAGHCRDALEMTLQICEQEPLLSPALLYMVFLLLLSFTHLLLELTCFQELESQAVSNLLVCVRYYIDKLQSRGPNYWLFHVCTSPSSPFLIFPYAKKSTAVDIRRTLFSPSSQ